MDILVIANGIAAYDGSPNISGGDVRFIEIMRRWGGWGHKIHLLSPPAGLELAGRFGCHVDQFHALPAPDGAGVVSYARRVAASSRLPRSLEGFRGLVYTTTEHIYDAMPAARLARKGNRWGAVVHWVSPPPWKRPAPGIINSTLFYAQQHLGLDLIRRHAHSVMAVSQPTLEDYVQTGGARGNTFAVACGIDLAWLSGPVSPSDYVYDAVYMKRLHPGKGIYDLIEIWGDVVKAKPDARLAVIGEGSADVRAQVQKRMAELGLAKNIDLIGPVYDVAHKLDILRSSRVFLLPSHEENWAIVIGEAMAAGLPVICYDLAPIRPVWQDSVIWSPFRDTGAFAAAVLKLLADRERWLQMQARGRAFVRKFDWDTIAARELEILSSGALGAAEAPGAPPEKVPAEC